MNLGLGEVLVLLVLGLLVFGPDKLPEIARNLGKAIRTFQAESSKVMDELRGATNVGVIDRPDAPKPALPSPAAGESPHADPADAPSARETSGGSQPAGPEGAAPSPSEEGDESGPPLIFEDT